MAVKLRWPKIYILGDSLTQFSFSKDGGWAAILANEFQRKADIIARGFSGYNTRHCKALLPYLESDFHNLTAVGVFLGANDAQYPFLNPQQAVPLHEYAQNLKDIIYFIKKKAAISKGGATSEALPMFLICPPPIDEARWHEECITKGKSSGTCLALVENYAAACVQTACELGLEYVDLYTEMRKQEGWKHFFNDGLHFSPKGAEFVAAQLSPLLTRLVRKENLGSTDCGIMPSWRHVSNTDPDSSFRLWLLNNSFGRSERGKN